MRFSVLALLLIATPADAAILKKASLIFCGTTAEMRATLEGSGFKPLMRGTQGSAGTGIGEIMVNAASEWFVVQIMPSEDLACVVLGGHGLKPVDPTKEGRKS